MKKFIIILLLTSQCFALAPTSIFNENNKNEIKFVYLYNNATLGLNGWIKEIINTPLENDQEFVYKLKMLIASNKLSSSFRENILWRCYKIFAQDSKYSRRMDLTLGLSIQMTIGEHLKYVHPIKKDGRIYKFSNGLDVYSIDDNLIGEGKFGKVFKVRNRNNENLAMKAIAISMDNIGILENTLREINIMYLLEGKENIMPILASGYYFEDLFTNYINNGKNIAAEAVVLYIVMPLYDFNLWQISQKLYRSSKKTIFYKVCLGVQAIHNAGLIHCDLKSENIMINLTGDVAIGDFGLSQKSGYVVSGHYGTPLYEAPEHVGALMCRLIDKNDIWALGVILAQLYGLADKITDNINWINIKDKILIQDLKDLFAGMLNFFPQERFNITQIIIHPYFTKEFEREFFDLDCNGLLQKAS